MGKKVITRQEVVKWYFEGKKEIYLDEDTILLPGAKDAVKAAGMTVKSCEAEAVKAEVVHEDTIGQTVEECCDEAKLDEAVKRKIVKAVIAKYMAKIGGE